MAKVTITFTDDDKGIHVGIQSDPHFPHFNCEQDRTPAQEAAIVVLHLAMKEQQRLKEEILRSN